MTATVGLGGTATHDEVGKEESRSLRQVSGLPCWPGESMGKKFLKSSEGNYGQEGKLSTLNAWSSPSLSIANRPLFGGQWLALKSGTVTSRQSPQSTSSTKGCSDSGHDWLLSVTPNGLGLNSSYPAISSELML